MSKIKNALIVTESWTGSTSVSYASRSPLRGGITKVKRVSLMEKIEAKLNKAGGRNG